MLFEPSPTHDTEIAVTVGDHGQYSEVRVGEEHFYADQGTDYGHHGGDGYSGGGDYCYKRPGCNGGSDGGRGGQGPHSNAGRGTGDDVTRYKFDYYVVTPGAGGEHYNISGWYCGGGGGGVMVNGHGPEASKHQGQGYGGGGYRHSRGGSDMNHGNPGVIIMEISP